MKISLGSSLIYVTISFFLNFSNIETDSSNFSISKNNEKSTASVTLTSEYKIKNTEQKPTFDNSTAKISIQVQAKAIEERLKNVLRYAVKQILPILMSSNTDLNISRECTRSILKYLSALKATKVWAIKMLDATSKIPAGIFDGTQSDFGSFDECMEISVPTKNGDEEFRGAYCTIQVKPHAPPVPKNFSFAHRSHAGPHETISAEILKAKGLSLLHSQFGICIPSACKIDDVQSIATVAEKSLNVGIRAPNCYVMEKTKLETIHILMIFILLASVSLVIIGTALDIKSETKEVSKKWFDTWPNILLAFSVTKNYKKLTTSSSGLGELRALHGIRALTMAWVILDHVSYWSNPRLLGRILNLQNYLNNISSPLLTNTWFCVDLLFFLSGLLQSYSYVPWMEKTKGKVNIAKYILQRYIRLTPTTLVVMGLIFFLPIITSGPFLYEQIDRQIESCRSRWWLNLLYINNWFSVEKICVRTTWYLAAEFQLYILSLLVLFPLYRWALFGYFVIGLGFLTSILAIGIVSHLHNLPPAIPIWSGDEKLVTDTVNIVHIKTFTHVGPYFIGLLTGYFVLKYKDIKISKKVCWLCWCLSVFSSIASLFGVYQWNIGYPPSLFWTCLYAGVQRITFIIGFAWIAFACATGRAGFINWFLSLYAFVPLSRLTFTTYLITALVTWTRKGTERERVYYSYYNAVYEWVADWFFSVLLALPLYLLVEAPISNLERLMFSGVAEKEKPENIQNEEPKTEDAVLTSLKLFR